MIIVNVLSMQEYGNPNVVRRLSNVYPPPGKPYEYSYWDYIDV